MSDQELSDIENTLVRQLTSLQEGFSDEDFAYLMSEIKDVRSSRGSDDFDELVEDLVTEMCDRSVKADTDSTEGPDEQVISDWVRDASITPDDEWSRIVAAAGLAG